MESSLRLRLVFKDPNIFGESQRAEGLKRAWISVKQGLETISEFSDHLVNVFELRDSCPNGLVLTIGGFVLPPFESTSILNERDVIKVKRKCGDTETARLCNERNCGELKGVVAEQSVNAGMKLLANEEFEKESGGYRSDSGEAEPEKLEVIEGTPKKTHNKKRKAAKKLNQSSGRKRRKRCESTEEALGTPEDVQKETEPEQNGCSNQHVLLLEKSRDCSDSSGGVENSSDSAIDEKEKNVNTSTPDEKRSGQMQENIKSNGVLSPVSNGSKSFPSRSTRRKRVKRQYLREKRLLEKEIQVQLDKPNNPRPSGKASGKSINEHQQEDECIDEEGAIVPVVVRPGHIRFEPLGKDDSDQAIQPYETPAETVKWNGTTNKKKGQKWGQETTGSYKWSDQENLNQEESLAAIPVVEDVVNVIAPIEFEKLTPCTALPQVGDTVAYRFIELSSSWSPEFSSFRVGKISKFDPGSDLITLVQVPEYPIKFEKDEDEAEESAAKSNMYGEDGSLQIEYTSLVDVRMVKHANKSTTKSGWFIISRAVAGDQSASSSSSPSWPDTNKQPKLKKSNSNKQPKLKKPSTTTAQENGKVNVWDEICNTLSAKKAELTKGEDWTKKASTPQSSWSYRGLRGSGIGLTMARLRAQNEL